MLVRARAFFFDGLSAIDGAAVCVRNYMVLEWGDLTGF